MTSKIDSSVFKKYDREYVAHFRGGATFVVAEIMIAAEVEERAEAHVRKMLGNNQEVYLRDLFPGGFIASSAGVFPTFAAAANSHETPERARYRMRDFIDVFTSYLPEFLPKEQGTVIRNSLRFGLDEIKLKNLRLYNILTSGITLQVAGMLAQVVAGSEHKNFVKQTLSQAFKAISDHRKQEEPLFDNSAARQVLMQEIGPDMKMSDLNANIVVTAQRAYPQPNQQVNHYFMNLVPGGANSVLTQGPMQPTPDTLMVDVVQSTIAVPLVTQAHNGLQDGGGLANGSEIIAYMSKNLKRGNELGYVSFANIGRSLFANGDLPETARSLREAANMESILTLSAKESHESAIQAMLDEHSYFLEVPVIFEDGANTIRFQGNAGNMLDTSAEQIEAIKQHAQSWINSNDAKIEELARNLAYGYIGRKENQLRTTLDTMIHSRDHIQLVDTPKPIAAQ